MYRANLEIESMDALNDFFSVISDELIRADEKEEIRSTINKADNVGWPCEITLEIEDEKWSDYSANHPDEAKVLEPHMTPVKSTE